MATPKTQPTKEQWTARALELCHAQHLTYTARHGDSEGTGDTDQWTVPSRDRSTTHSVRYDAATDTWTCDCVAGEHGLACCHVGAAIHWCQQRDAAIRSADRCGEAWAWWMAGGEW